MEKNLGYTKPLLLWRLTTAPALPKIFWVYRENRRQSRRIRFVITNTNYRCCSRAGIPKEQAAVLVDEFSASRVLKKQSSRSLTIILTTEKSGKDEFSFELRYGFWRAYRKIRADFY